MTAWASALSTAPELAAAFDEVAATVESGLDGPPDVVFAFGTPDHPLAALPTAVLDRWSGAVLVGGCGGGVLGDGREVEQSTGLSLLAGRLPGVQLHPFHLGPREVATTIASPLFARQHLGLPEAAGVLLFADPFTCPAEPLLPALDLALPDSVKVGGIVSGVYSAGEARLFVGDRVEQAGLAGLALTGEIEVEAAVAQGCRPVGPTLQITACQGQLLIELDGKPAAEALPAMLESLEPADRVLARASLFLGLVADGDGSSPGDLLVRNLLGMDADAGVIAVATQLTLGQHVRFCVRDRAGSVADVHAVLHRAGPAEAGLLFSCLGRGEALLGEPHHDSQAFVDRKGAPVAGFFGNGEIGPVGGQTWMHAYTASYALLRAP